jgi:hypothetical protein
MDDIQWHSFYGLNKYLWNSSIGKDCLYYLPSNDPPTGW